MKQIFKKRMARALAVLLSVAMITCFVPQASAQVYAESGDPLLELSTDVLGTGVNTDSAQTVYYGVNGGSPIAWRVIKYKGAGNAYIENQDGSMTLFAAGNLTSDVQFASNGMNEYATSNLKVVLDGNDDDVVGMYESLFSTKEQSAIKSHTLGVDGYTNQEPYCTGVSGDSENPPSGYLWPLSTAEALALPSDKFRSASGSWWLRSPGHFYYAAFVNNAGAVNINGNTVYSKYGVRPAFNLNLSSVLFTSAAEGGKSSGAAGDGSLEPVSANSTGEWKLTVHDSSRDVFKASAATGAVLSQTEGYDSWSVPIACESTSDDPYTVTPMPDDNDYVSVILADSSDNALYYGNIAKADNTGPKNVTIPTGLAAGKYKLHVFYEKINDDKLTDYSSVFRTIDLTVNAGGPTPETFEVIFDPAGGKWKDGSTGSKTLTVESGQAVTAPEEPAKDDYDFAGWYDGDKLVDLSEITSNLTVTAHWEEKTAPTPETFEVIFDPNGGKWKDGSTGSKTLTVESGQAVTAPEEPAKDDYDFAGWYDGDKPADLSKITSNLTVTAHWEEKTAPTPETFEVIFDPNGGKWKDGSTGSKTLTVESGQAVTAPEEPAKDDYDFAGWYDGDKPADLSKITSNLTVTAHWEEKEKPAPISIEDAEVVLKKSSFVYNTKVQKPSKITVKTKDGNVLKKGTDYTVKWPNTPKNVGSHTVTIKGTGNYTGIVKATYKIRPLGTSVKTFKRLKGGMYHIEWKKKSTLMSTSRITGYQIQIANNSRFNKTLKTVKVKGYKKVSTTIRTDKKLIFKYARIRTFKTIKGKNYYSNWSEIKKEK